MLFRQLDGPEHPVVGDLQLEDDNIVGGNELLVGLNKGGIAEPVGPRNHHNAVASRLPHINHRHAGGGVGGLLHMGDLHPRGGQVFLQGAPHPILAHLSQHGDGASQLSGGTSLVGPLSSRNMGRAAPQDGLPLLGQLLYGNHHIHI